MALYDYNGLTALPADHNKVQGEWEVISDRVKATAQGVASDALLVVPSKSDGVISVDITNFSGSVSTVGGIIFRYLDEDNYFIFIFTPSNGNTRIVKIENGVSSNLLSQTVAINDGTGTRTLSLNLSGNTIQAFINSTQIGSDVTSEFNKTETGVGFRAGDDTYAFDNFSLPDPEGQAPAGKSITFSLAAQIRGKSNVNYIVTPNPVGDSITSGSLNTSGESVTLVSAAINALAAGTPLLLIATDKQEANDNSDVIAWDASTVVEV